MNNFIYIEIFNKYKNDIISGKYKTNEKLPSYREIANKYNISRMTANKVIHELVVSGLAYNLRGVGTFVSAGTDKPVILLVSEISSITTKISNWHSEFIDKSFKDLTHLGYIPKLCIGQGDNVDEFILSTHLDDENYIKSISGVILDTIFPYLEIKLREKKIPVVSFSTAIPVGNNCVVLNYSKMGELAVDTLKNKNIDKYDIIFYNYANKYLYSERKEFLDKLDNIICNMSPNKLVPVNTYDFKFLLEDITNTFKNWWHSNDRSDTLFFFEDSILTICLDIINEMGIKIGKDLKILTHANSKMTFNTNVNLYKIGFDVDECADLVVESLDNIIKNKEQDNIIYLDPFIKKGDSLG